MMTKGDGMKPLKKCVNEYAFEECYKCNLCKRFDKKYKNTACGKLKE